MTQKFKLTFGVQKPKHDSRNVFANGELIGFQPKCNKKICVTFCPVCETENYAFSVTSGVCCWCGWDANKAQETMEKKS